MTLRELSKIAKLWAVEEVPVDNALHFADGRSYDVSIDPGIPGGMKVLEQFDLDERLSLAPGWVSVIDGLKVPLPGGGYLWRGDGDNGAEGFFARTTQNDLLEWVVFFTASNPFTEVELSGNQATFRSTSGVIVTVDIDDPRGQCQN